MRRFFFYDLGFENDDEHWLVVAGPYNVNGKGISFSGSQSKVYKAAQYDPENADQQMAALVREMSVDRKREKHQFNYIIRNRHDIFEKLMDDYVWIVFKTSGGILPLLVSVFAPIKLMVIYQYSFSIVFLALSGAVAAKVGGSTIMKGIIRICFWGTVAMGITALVGYLFAVKTA